MLGRAIKVAAAALAAAALVAGGYAIGTRGDGSAAAAGRQAAPHAWRHQRGPGHGAMLGALAGKLGVSEAKLMRALKELRPQRRDARRANRVSELAKAFGITEAQARAGLAKLRAQRLQDRAQRRDAFVNGLAAKLGVAPAKVRAALDDFGPRRRAPRWR